MSVKKYKKEQINPNNKEWVDAGVATLLDSEAEILNASSKSSGIRYVLTSENKNLVKIGDKEFEKKDVIESLKIVEVKLNSNTGEKKVLEAFNDLSDENKTIVLEQLSK